MIWPFLDWQGCQIKNEKLHETPQEEEAKRNKTRFIFEKNGDPVSQETVRSSF